MDVNRIARILAGYRKNHIPRGQMTPAAVLFPLVETDAGLSVLLLVRSNEVDRHKGEVAFPGGSVDPTDSDALEAALREAREEIGLHAEHVRILGELDDYITVTGFHITPFLGILDSMDGLSPKTVETSRIFTVPMDFFMQPGNVIKREISWKGQQREVYFCEYNQTLIWGATLAIIIRFIEVINEG